MKAVALLTIVATTAAANYNLQAYKLHKHGFGVQLGLLGQSHTTQKKLINVSTDKQKRNHPVIIPIILRTKMIIVLHYQ